LYKILLLIYVNLFVCWGGQVFAQKPIDINTANQWLGLRHSFAMYPDSTNTITQGNVIAHLGQFKALRHTLKNNAHYYWLSAKFINKTDASNRVSLYYWGFYPEKIEIFELQQNRLVSIAPTITIKTLKNIFLTFKPKEAKHIIIKLTQNNGANLDLYFTVMTIKQLENFLDTQQKIGWFYIGVCFIIFCISIIAFLFLKHLNYLYYAILILVSLPAVLHGERFITNQLQFIAPLFKSPHFFHFCYSLGILFFTLYFKSLFKIKNDRIIEGYIWTNIVLIVAVILHKGYWSNVFISIQYFLIFGNAIIFLYILLKSYKSQLNLVVLVGISLLPIVLLVLYLLVSFLNVIPGVYFHYKTSFWYKCASMFEFLMLIFASLHQYLLLIKKKNRLQLSLAKSKYNEKIAQIYERERIANDLHDEFSNALLALKIYAKSELSNATLASKLDDLVLQMRKITHNLATVDFDRVSLNDSILYLVENFNTICKVRFDFHSHGLIYRLLNEKNTEIYRILLESINNVIKHSNASVCTIQFSYMPSELVIIIEDNGTKTSADTELVLGLGLKSITRRVENMQGSVSFEYDNHGFVTSILLPV
jgi:signal transduction histidine kinase